MAHSPGIQEGEIQETVWGHTGCFWEGMEMPLPWKSLTLESPWGGKLGMVPRAYHWKLCEVVQSVATWGGANQGF